MLLRAGIQVAHNIKGITKGHVIFHGKTVPLHNTNLTVLKAGERTHPVKQPAMFLSRGK